jgi:hypothetical protein
MKCDIHLTQFKTVPRKTGPTVKQPASQQSKRKARERGTYIAYWQFSFTINEIYKESK